MMIYGVGYPYNLDFDYGALGQLQHFSINNLGDPFIESNYGVHSRPFEVGVLDWFARLWEIERDDYWGYITNCGTEGNLHGILVGYVFFVCVICFQSVLDIVFLSGERCYLMGFCMLRLNRITLCLKQLVCIEWNVTRLIRLSPGRLTVMISEESCWLTKINPPFLMLT